MAATTFNTLQQRIRKLEQENVELRAAATTDAMTGALNWRGAEMALLQAAKRSNRTGSPLTILALDIDNFKAINDSGGHAAGDQALKNLVRELHGSIRSTDSLARMGGDEFIIITDTSQSEAAIMGEKLLAVAQRVVFSTGDGVERHLSISIGVSEVHDSLVEAAMQRADGAMYRAKACRRRGIPTGAYQGADPDKLVLLTASPGGTLCIA
jgi:diguanylate cyclase (GGDEF)-like protein